MLRGSEEEFMPKRKALMRYMEHWMAETRARAVRTGFFDIMTGKPPKR